MISQRRKWDKIGVRGLGLMVRTLETITLPPACRKGKRSLEECLSMRRTVREFSEAPLSVAEAGQLMWAAQGITSPEKQRTAPSAARLYPLDVYVVAGNMEFPAGIYRYLPERHQLLPLQDGDKRPALCKAAPQREFLPDVPMVVVITGTRKRTAQKFPDDAMRFMCLEAGHVMQNILLEATALGLICVPMGAFSAEEARKALKPAAGEDPLYMTAIGKPLK